VSTLVHSSMQQYAVISVRTAPCCERLVIAYPDEKALRDFLAGPSIVALGYSTREEAEASMYDSGNTGKPLPGRSMAPLVANGAHSLKGFVSSHLLAKDRFSLGKREGNILGLLQQTFAAAVVVLYSKNLLCAAIRAFISC
jgi:hypothetical protein